MSGFGSGSGLILSGSGYSPGFQVFGYPTSSLIIAYDYLLTYISLHRLVNIIVSKMFLMYNAYVDKNGQCHLTTSTYENQYEVSPGKVLMSRLKNYLSLFLFFITGNS